MTHPMTVLFTVLLATSASACTDEAGLTSPADTLPEVSGYPIVGTNQNAWYDNQDAIVTPAPGDAFHGQNADHPGTPPSYRDNGDGTVTDLVTGLMWSQSPDLDGDGDIDVTDKLTYAEAASFAAEYRAGGYSDWRLPTIKELYSLIRFSGVDPSGYEGTSTASLVPFIDTDFFDFAYGDTGAGERIIDAQYASSTEYVDRTGGGSETLFGVNFADGRIKGYGLSLFGRDKTFYVVYVRGNPTYGINDFVDNGDGTISDQATGLMWMAGDSGEGLNWQEALAYAESFEHAGYADWRLPDAKELQSIVDYSRSPGTTGSAAIDPVFISSAITNEAGEQDFPSYWSSTTHVSWSQVAGGSAAYVSFGRAMGYMNRWVDVHGAGSQRSDPKAGDPADFPTGRGPQGDAIRIYNHVRLVRNM